MTLFEVLTIVAVQITLLIGVYTFAGRKWKGEYDAEHNRAERLEATLVEKDHSIEDLRERVATLDAVVQELGGRRVFEAITEMQRALAEGTAVFLRITEQIAQTELRQREALDAHEARATERSQRMLGLIQTVGVEIHQLVNGKE